jgi:hypothetical protein
MRILVVGLILVALLPTAAASESCLLIHGRAHYYGGDGQLRIWHIGTRHQYKPDETSDERVIKWLEAGNKETERSRYASPASMVCLFADFLICPTEPFKKGSVQKAKVKSASHRHYVDVGAPTCFGDEKK